MKKNIMMRAASGLAVATLLTTSLISGTFAKYTTTAEGSDSARVAKWGVEITANGGTFANSYAKDDQATTIANTVVSTDKVVAPGTGGQLANAHITGTPEVAVKVEYKPTLTLTGWTLDDGTVYCPIVFKVGDETYGLSGMRDSNKQAPTVTATDINDLKGKVESAIEGYSKEYDANTDLSTKSQNKAVDVSWNWAFDNDDTNDTKLGNSAINNASKIELSITTTVTQID